MHRFGRGTFGSSQKISNPFGEAAPLDWDLLRYVRGRVSDRRDEGR